MRFSLLICFAAVLSGTAVPAFAQKKEAPRIGVVVFPVSSQNPIDVKNADHIRLLVSKNISAVKSLAVVNTDTLDKFMHNNDVSVYRLYNSAEMKKIPLDFVQYLVTGFVSVEEKAYTLKMNFLDLSDKEFLFSEETRMDKNEAFFWGSVKAFTGKFIEKIESTLSLYDTETSPSYRIGDTGPAGGIIFYVKHEYAEGWRYLEAAPPETEFRAAWGMEVDGVIIPAFLDTTSGIGSGCDNTEIFAAHSSLYGARKGRTPFASLAHGLAAMRCRALDSGGYKDWFLPSKDELMYMYTNLARRGLGGFSGDTYWSSTESAYEYAHAQSFREGRQFFNGYKPMPLSVRAVRAF
ncbi:MAG: DUF1566 domain-containing protein [Spirochaetaceae bacterium]|jgi:hypothetical protein|nr:DUF1566 domain-containing protein [Spirochaetaceae bacterium]